MHGEGVAVADEEVEDLVGAGQARLNAQARGLLDQDELAYANALALTEVFEGHFFEAGILDVIVALVDGGAQLGGIFEGVVRRRDLFGACGHRKKDAQKQERQRATLKSAREHGRLGSKM